MAKDTVRTLTVRAKDEGLDAVAAKLRKVGDEAKQAGDGVDTFSNDTVEGAARLGNLDRQLDSLGKRLAGMPQAFGAFERDARTLKRGLDAGKISAQEFTRQMQELQTRLQKTIAPRLGLNADQSGLRRLIDGQVELDAATRRSVLTMIRQQEQVETMARRSTAAINAETAAIRLQSAALNDNRRAGAGSFQTANIAAQFQDIGVTAAMGMSPLQIALQQGTQLQAVLGPMGAAGAVSALGSAFMSLINPVSLLTLGFVGLTAAAIQYFTSSEEEANSVEETFKRHSATITALRDAYGDAASGIREFAKESKAVADALSVINTFSLNNQLTSQVSEIIDGGELFTRNLEAVNAEIVRLRQEQLEAFDQQTYDEIEARIASLNEAIETGAQGILTASDSFAPFREELDRFAASIRAGTPDVIRLREELAQRINADPTNKALVEMAAAINRIVEEAYRTQSALGAMADGVDNVGKKALDVAGKVKAFSQAMEGMSRLAAAPVSDRQAAKDFFDEAIKRASGLDDMVAALAEYEAALKRIQNREDGAAVPIPTPRPNDIQILDWLTEEQERLTASYRSAIEAGRNRIEQMQLEVQVVGKAGIEADALRMRLDLLQKAQKSGVAVTAEQIEEINKLADAWRDVATQLAQAQAMEDIMFDRSMIGMSRGDQQIMTYLRQRGLDINTEQGQIIAGQLRYNQVLQETQDEMQRAGDIGKEAFMSILDILYETGDIGDKLIGIFAQLGKQFAQMGMEKLWKSISGEGKSNFDGAMGAVASWPEMAGGGRGWSPVASQQVGQAIGQSIAPAITSSLNGSLQSYAAAIRKIESGSYEGNYSAMGPVLSKGSYAGDRAYGAYQVMGKNIASWTKEAIGTSLSIQQFLADKGAQDRVFAHKFGQSVEKFGTFADGASVWFSGRPLSKAGNASDGYNTVPQYVQKAQSALDNYPGGLKAGVSDGVIDATRKIAHMPEMAGGAAAVAPGVAGQPQQGAGMFGGMNMNTMMAGVGAFAGGMQSGDPLGGAIGGGLGMLGAGAGPLGIAAGAVLGLVGGLIGKAKQKKEELKKARQELEQQMGAITDLIARATGNFMGSYQSQLMQTSDEFTKAIALAEKAKNTKLVKELNDAQDEFFDNVADRWQRNFDGMIASMEAGMGLDSAYMAGMDAVEKMRETLVGFVNDAKMFSEAGDDLAGWLTDLKGIVKESGLLNRYMDGITDLPDYFAGGINVSQDMKDAVERWKGEIEKFGIKVFNEGTAPTRSDAGTPITAVYETVDGLRDKLRDLGVEFNEQGEIIRAAADANGVYADAVEQARQAAIKTALAAISGADELTAMEEAVDKAQGAAKNMASLLDDLGMSAEEAARAIESHLNLAMAKMRDAYLEELNASINDLSGFGFLNEIVDAQRRYNDRLRDAAALGLGGELALREFNLSLIDIVNSAELSRQELDILAASFPKIGELMSEGLIGQAAASVSKAKSDLRAAYEKEASELERVISAMKRFIDQVKDLREQMRLDASISTLNPFERLTEAQTRFRDVFEKAQAGDEEARDDLTRIARAYLDEAADYFASTDEYYAIWKEVDQALGGVLTTSERSLSEAEKQLEALKEQVSLLIDINDSVMSVEEAIMALAAAMENFQLQVQAAASAGGATAGAAYETYLGRTAREDELAYWAGTGKSGEQIVQDIKHSPEAQINDLYKSIMGRNADTAGSQYWLNSGKSIDQIAADLAYAKSQGSFSSGGFTGNLPTTAVAGVVHGQEFVMNAEATRRWRPQFEAINAGNNPWGGRPGNDNGLKPEHLDRLARNFEASIKAQTERLEAKFDAEIAELKGQRSDARLSKQQPRRSA